MSGVYEALRQMEKEQAASAAVSDSHPANRLAESIAGPAEPDCVPAMNLKASPSPRLVALWEPHGLGAEKFRALVTRLENLRRQKDMKSLQVTSGVINEGKTLVATNLAVTFARRSRSKVLLLEGDLRRPSIAEILGQHGLRGISQWWSEEGEDIASYFYRLSEMSLWILSAGASIEQASHVLQSDRFAAAFHRLRAWFDWIVVDSTPMLPIADTNLWSRLVDGTLLVVREGVASKRALKKGLQSLDNLKLIGTVLNEGSELDRTGYANQYYGAGTSGKRKLSKQERITLD